MEHATLSKSGVVLFGSSAAMVTCDCDQGYGINASSALTTQSISCLPDQSFEEASPCLGEYVHSQVAGHDLAPENFVMKFHGDNNFHFFYMKSYFNALFSSAHLLHMIKLKSYIHSQYRRAVTNYSSLLKIIIQNFNGLCLSLSLLTPKGLKVSLLRQFLR